MPTTTGTAVTRPAVGGPMALDVTAAVSAMYAGTTGDSSFLLRYQSETGSGGENWWATWPSRESSTDKPVLEPTYQ